MSDNEKIDILCKAAAKWWGNKIRGNGSHHDNGDREGMGGIAGVLADMMNKPIDDADVDKFEVILSEKIRARNEKYGGYSYMSIYCDYGPDRILYDSAKEAGIETNNFPWKTGMYIDFGEGKIEVRDGYRASMKKIFPNENA